MNNIPYVIAVCHQKGGVAKTTTVLALGACLADTGQRTLIIDLDPSANLTAGLGITPSKAYRSVANVLLGNDVLFDLIRQTALPGMDLIPSNMEVATANRFLHLRPNHEHLLQKSLAQLAQDSQYAYILIDCPPSLDLLTIGALTGADLALIPIHCEYYSLQALESVFKTIETVRAKGNPGLRYRLLVTMFDKRGSLHKRVLEYVREKYAAALLQTIVGFDTKIRESQLLGIPLTLHAPGTRAVQQYRSLANELRAYVKTQTVSQPA